MTWFHSNVVYGKTFYLLVCSQLSPLILLSSGCVVSGAGALEVALADALVKHKPNVKGRAQLGVQAFADALLVIPKVTLLTLFANKHSSHHVFCSPPL